MSQVCVMFTPCSNQNTVTEICLLLYLGYRATLKLYNIMYKITCLKSLPFFSKKLKKNSFEC